MGISTVGEAQTPGTEKDDWRIPKMDALELTTVIREESGLYRRKLPINYQRTCRCGRTHINCLTAKEWLKRQLGVWQFNYEVRDIRDKSMHPATFPISLARRVIELFTHQGELVLDPFVGSGMTLVAARDTNRNAVGFDLLQKYIDLCGQRLSQGCVINDKTFI
jgi:DNA modification methylase